MKKITSLIFIILTSILLVSCGTTKTKKYVVEFYSEGKLKDIYLVEKGKLIENPPVVEKEGYVFKYWEKDGEEFKVDIEKIIKNIKLDAKFEKRKEVNSEGVLNFYYLNDFHGAVLENKEQMGLAKIGNLVIDEFEKDNTIFLAGGDMLQGQYISNSNNGAVIIESFNEMKLDAFVVGNHEFDWTIDEVLKFFDPNTTGVKANFPILGANIYHKGTNTRPDFIEPYTVIERAGIKIGIIGVIGFGLENSIEVSKVRDYEFKDPYQEVVKYSEILRKDEKVDVVAVVNHGSSQTFNQNVASLTGNREVDLIFNGHSHREEYGYVYEKPYIQSKANGERLGLISLSYSNEDEFIVNHKESNIKNLRRQDDQRLNYDNKEVSEIVKKYYDPIKDYYEDVIIETKESFSRDDISRFITKLMRVYTNADIGIQNNGGTRSSFPKGMKITKSDIFEVFPFDNKIVIFESTGYTMQNFVKGSWITTTANDGIFLSKLDYNKKYVIATNDYVFNSNTQLNEGIVKVYELDLFEIFVDALINMRDNGEKYLSRDSEIIIK